MFDTLKDYSIVYSFDQTGYHRHAKHFSPFNPAQIAGKHFLVTGGSRGIGEAAVKALLDMGATVTVTARSSKDFDENFAGVENVQFKALDLANFDAIRNLSLGHYDGLVLNAGGMPSQLTVYDNQYDTIFASQIVGHYLLMRRLIEERRLKVGSPIHWVSSGGMYPTKLSLDDLAWQKRPYDKVKSYSNTKRAQVVLNALLAKRYKGYVFSCSHPGWVGTAALAEALPGFTGKLGARLRTAEQGADTIVWCLEQGTRLPTGKFWFDRKPRKEYPFFWTKESESDRHALLDLLEQAWQQAQKSEVFREEMSVN